MLHTALQLLMQINCGRMEELQKLYKHLYSLAAITQYQDHLVTSIKNTGWL
jgi:hypothetical protein